MAPSAYQPPGNSYSNPIQRPWAPGYLPTQMDVARTTPYSGGAGSAGGGDPSREGMAGVANRIIQDTEGRGDATMSDPYLTAALSRLSDIQSGKAVPFTDAVKSQMVSRHGDMSAAAEAANAEDLRESVAAGGGNMSDPSARARLSQGTQQRQAENLGYAGDVDTNSTLQNFQAQNDATHAITGTRLSQLNEANGQYNLGAHYHSGYTQQGDHVPGFQYQPPATQPWAGASSPSYQFGGGSSGDTSSPWASDNGGSVWAGSGVNNPPPQYYGNGSGPSYPNTTGSQSSPVYVNQDPYGGQGSPGYNFGLPPLTRRR